MNVNEGFWLVVKVYQQILKCKNHSNKNFAEKCQIFEHFHSFMIHKNFPRC